MKKLIIFLIIIITIPLAGTAKNKPYLPFSKKSKSGILGIKKIIPVREKYAWIYRQRR